MGNYIPYNRELFVSRLKMLRKENGYTQPTFGKMVGKTKGAIGHYEIGNREPGLGMVYKFAKIFNVSVDFMLGNSDFRNEQDTTHYMLEKLRETGLIKNDTLDKKTVDKFIKYITMINEIKE